MSSPTTFDPPPDYPQRVKSARGLRGLTQTQLAELIGVSFATVNRWENGQSRPNNLSWRRILEIENQLDGDAIEEAAIAADLGPPATPDLDFSANPDAVWALAEAHRLGYGHLFNPAFASETSLIDPLPHQRLAVYEHMLRQSPLRFLLADDAGAGKTIMTGLYVREMLARRLIRRVLVVPPAGLVGNWHREMRDLFRMQFRVVGGTDARSANPFAGPESDRVIVSVDTLAGERMFNRLGNDTTEPYDLVVFDEAHKLSASRQPDFRVRKTGRYQLAEAIAGAGADNERWSLPWSAQHLLLLTATPHMGKDFPYYSLWRLLLPDALSTEQAFNKFPDASKQRHFIRRTKEELFHFDGSPLYPERRCDTLSYGLTRGPNGEQELYEETTDYIRGHYNRARMLNRSAARLAMSVFQRRLVSSTFALMRSFERRMEKLEDLIKRIRDGSLSEEQLIRQQRRLDDDDDDLFETKTADEQSAAEGEVEQEEAFEDRALGGTVGTSLAELEVERLKVESLLNKARSLFARGEESKFEKLRDVLRDPDYAGEKLIIFTEHRDTASFLFRRLEGLGFTGQVASIHGGMPYQERERQVEFFRSPVYGGGANYLVATDAAGEGINLQFCWLMVNYDIPWNPARLEQRMGRIHRYGQAHNPVVVVNLIAGSTREGRVLKTLLEKLETIRKQLRSDKVFDVIGRIFEGVSIKEYLEQSLAGEEPEATIARLDGTLTAGQVRAIEDRERNLFGSGGEVKRELAELNAEVDLEGYRKLLPGYVRNFVEKAAPLLDLRIEGDQETAFRLVATRPGALDPLLPALEMYAEDTRDRLTMYRTDHDGRSVWLHPGEPIFDRISASVSRRFGVDGLKGSVFVDPYATEPYLFHLAVVTVEQMEDRKTVGEATFLPGSEGVDAQGVRLRESRLIGLRQTGGGSVEEWPVESLLLLKGASNFAPGSEPLAAMAKGLGSEAEGFARDAVAASLVQGHRQEILQTMPERINFAARGFDFQVAELAAARSHLQQRAQAGDQQAMGHLTGVKERQRSLSAIRTQRLDSIRAEPDTIRPGEVEFLVHALVVPSQDPDEMEVYDAEVESIAVSVATAYEERFNADVKDVSRPALARRAGLTDWPGFDLLSERPVDADNPAHTLAIEVKGRRGYGGIEVSDNEWAKACNLRSQYWLYVVFDCATAHPRLVRICDPFGKLLTKSRESTTYAVSPRALEEAAES